MISEERSQEVFNMMRRGETMDGVSFEDIYETVVRSALCGGFHNAIRLHIFHDKDYERYLDDEAHNELLVRASAKLGYSVSRSRDYILKGSKTINMVNDNNNDNNNDRINFIGFSLEHDIKLTEIIDIRQLNGIFSIEHTSMVQLD